MILLSAGHNPESPGACHNGFCEYEEAVKWVHLLQLLLRQRTHVDVVPTGKLSQKIAWINAYTAEPVDLAVEIHFNSDESKKQRGSETLYAPGSIKGQRAARIVQDSLSSLLGPNRGAKEGWYRMILPPDPAAVPDAFLAKTNPVALILEPEFIYNRIVIESLRQVSCEILCDALIDAVEVIK